MQPRHRSCLQNKLVNLSQDVLGRHQVKVASVCGHGNDVLGKFSAENACVKVLQFQSGKCSARPCIIREDDSQRPHAFLHTTEPPRKYFESWCLF
jgi:hypothetical protein